MTSSGQPEIAVIIVNYGTAALAVEAVDSVLGGDHGGRLVEVHLVDNASPGGDADLLREIHGANGWQGRVTLHLEAVNHGFGRGNNLVLEQLAARPVPPDLVFLLNPDARLQGETLAALADFLDAHPRAAAAGAQILRPGSGVVTSAFRFPGVASEFAHALSFGPVARWLGRHGVALPPGLPTGPVDWVSGAAVMLRAEALREVGGFDPDFFLYHEEVELMFRLRRAGWEVWHVAGAQVAHDEGVATGVRSAGTMRSRRPDYWYDSFGLYHRKTRGRAGALLVSAGRIVGWGLNRPLAWARGREPAGPPGWGDGMWRRVLRPLLGLPPGEVRR